MLLANQSSKRVQIQMICHFKVMVDGEERWVEADKVFTYYLKKHFKKEQKVKDALELREEKFKDSVYKFDTYSKDMLTEFIDYWTEPNKSGSKMKFESEKTWSLSRRLKRWSKNGFGKKTEPEADGRTIHKKIVASKDFIESMKRDRIRNRS